MQEISVKIAHLGYPVITILLFNKKVYFVNKTGTYTKNNHCPKRTGHLIHNKIFSLRIYFQAQSNELQRLNGVKTPGNSITWFRVNTRSRNK